MEWLCASSPAVQQTASLGPALRIDVHRAVAEVVDFSDSGVRFRPRALRPSRGPLHQAPCACELRSVMRVLFQGFGRAGFHPLAIRASRDETGGSGSSASQNELDHGIADVERTIVVQDSAEDSRTGESTCSTSTGATGESDCAAGAKLGKPRRRENLFTTVVRPLIKVVDGTLVTKRGSVEDSLPRDGEGRSKVSLFWNPLAKLEDAVVRKTVGEAWRQAEADFYAFTGQLGKYIFIMMSTGVILATGFQLSDGTSHEEGVLWFSWLAGIIIGSMIGANQVLENHCKRGTRNVVITGSTRGLGKALAREFLRSGDNVCIASRSVDSVRSTVEELEEEFQGSQSRVIGIACDVSKSEDVKALGDLALQEFGFVDIWVNNAGVNKGFRPLVEFSDNEIEQISGHGWDRDMMLNILCSAINREQIVSTNLVGSILCTREAIQVMKSQGKAGHIFNMDGAGSGGSSTPLTAVYGATKSGLRQLHASLLQECKGYRVGIHTASPGMVLTDLLLSGATLQNKKMFNFICEQPETVARALVPLMRTVKGTGKAVNYLTPPRIILAIVTAWLRRGRWFDEEGRAVYAAEADRLRMWAEGREKSSVTAAMELVPSGTWVSLFSSSVICAYIILSSSSGGNLPGT